MLVRIKLSPRRTCFFYWLFGNLCMSLVLRGLSASFHLLLSGQFNASILWLFFARKLCFFSAYVKSELNTSPRYTLRIALNYVYFDLLRFIIIINKQQFISKQITTLALRYNRFHKVGVWILATFSPAIPLVFVCNYLQCLSKSNPTLLFLTSLF